MKPLLIVLSLFITAKSFSQEGREDVYALDENWKDVKLEKAKYLVRSKKINDTCWKWDFYNLIGPLIKTEYFKDEAGAIAHGSFSFYNLAGRIDSTCRYVDGLAHGTWNFYNEKGKIMLQKNYQAGRLLEVKDVVKDTVKKSDGMTHVEVESEFPGGLSAWGRHINKYLKYPERALNHRVEGQVSVVFIIDEEGKVGEPTIFRSVEFSLDDAALEIIRKSPKWRPGIKDGVKVKTFKRQPINYALPK